MMVSNMSDEQEPSEPKPPELPDSDEFKIMVDRGTKAWADVPDSTAWLERLRGVIPPQS